jgi:DNA excision repair protein ERCC-1
MINNPMIKVSPLQKGNNVLSYLSQSSWQYDDSITPDYEINHTTAILFLSLRFHSCKPEYIHKRVRKLKPYKLRILLVQVDVPAYAKALQELYSTTTMTVVLGFSYEECSRYIQGFNLSSSRPIDGIRRKENDSNAFLSCFPKINKSDIAQVNRSCETLEAFLVREDMTRIPGFGKAKAEEISRYLNMPFR